MLSRVAPLSRTAMAARCAPMVSQTDFSTRSATMVRENKFKAAIQRGDRQIGLWSGLGNNMVAEMISHVSGFDWFVIDMEHSPNDIGDVLVQLQCSQHGNAEPIVSRSHH
jgi:2-keto-3-deoxy-L-rhamnonate aldolase RhmA